MARLDGDLLVIKCGGAAGVSVAAVAADTAGLAGTGRPVVLVHGGSAERDALAERLGIPTPTLTSPAGVSSRFTTEAGIDVLLLALAGRVKPNLVSQLVAHGVSAVGLTGLDGGLLRAVRRPARRAVVDGRVRLVRGDRAGRLARVEPGLLRTLLAAGHVPVVSPPALDEHGEVVNVDADRVAAALAVALGARQLVLLTAAPGVLADPAEPGSVLSELCLPPEGELPTTLQAGMWTKAFAAREALNGGVASVMVADGRCPAPVTAALAGAGTVIRRGPGPARTGESAQHRRPQRIGQSTGQEDLLWQAGSTAR